MNTLIPAIGTHTTRIVRSWIRRPDSWLLATLAPLVYLFIVYQLFGALIRQFAGQFSEINAVLLVCMTWAFILITVDSPTIFNERRLGLYDRFATLPSTMKAALLGRILAYFLRACAVYVVVIGVAVVFTSFGPSAAQGGRLIGVLLVVAMTSSILGTWIGFVIKSLQGAVAIFPLILLAMFVNTAMLPADRFRPFLRSFVEYMPFSTAHSVVVNPSALNVCIFALWFVGISILCLWGLKKTTQATE